MATRYAFLDDSGEVRLGGYLQPEPGGSIPSLDEVLVAGGNPAGNHVTGTLTVDLPTPGTAAQFFDDLSDLIIQILTASGIKLRGDPAALNIQHSNGDITLYINKDEAIFGQHAVPASGDLDPSTFALWLDDTPGATKLMIKAKDSGGTVRTGSVNLT